MTAASTTSGNTYTWDQAFDYVTTLNNICANDETVDCSVNGKTDCAGVGGKCGFGGKRDWRLPNYKELMSILNLDTFDPAVSPVFNNNCVLSGATVLTGSCTASSSYWSSTTIARTPPNAYIVEFQSGFGGSSDKASFSHVRAVRGGSP